MQPGLSTSFHRHSAGTICTRWWRFSSWLNCPTPSLLRLLRQSSRIQQNTGSELESDRQLNNSRVNQLDTNRPSERHWDGDRPLR